jgi:hypothetical protein
MQNPFFCLQSIFDENASLTLQNRFIIEEELAQLKTPILPSLMLKHMLLTYNHGSLCVSLYNRCIIEEELAQLKTSILQSLMLLPENALVGLITFGKNVHIHELAFDECPKS